MKQGFTANLVTSLLVAGASRLGLPVSTTHFAVGSLFGTSLVNRTANAKTIQTILLAWVTTLPLWTCERDTLRRLCTSVSSTSNAHR